MRPGERIGEYTIVSKIGEGGMSIVYLAEHTGDRTRVVVKELKEQYRFDQQLVDRFLRGAEILQELRHPHLAQVYACLEHDGKHVMVEEYLSGGSLADLLDHGEPYTEKEALCWCRDALRALDYAHGYGIVHRDVKPNNLMLDEHRQVKVIDFGIARVFGEARFTRTNDAAPGTLEYMSPEQILAPDQVIHLTDVYSMGIVLYELLSGRVPFEGTTPFEIQERITRQPPAAIRHFRTNTTPMNPHKAGIDPKLVKIIMRAIEKRPERRFGGCGEFALQLNRRIEAEKSPTWTRRCVDAIRQAAARFQAPSSRKAVGALLLLSAFVVWGVNTAWRAQGDVSAPPPVVSSPSSGPVKPPGPAPVREIRLVKEVAPAEVRAAGTVVTYKYLVTNAGNTALKKVKVTDDEAAPSLRSGDANGDGMLDVAETWIYEASLTTTQAQLDAGSDLRSIALASSDDDVVSTPASATVTFKQRPVITVETSLSATELNAPGPVIFTYRVSNTGNVSLTGIKITDQHTIRPVLDSGDTNGNNVLDVGEIWQYTCKVVLSGKPNPFVSKASAKSDQVTSEPVSATVAIVAPHRQPPLPGSPTASSKSPVQGTQVTPEHPPAEQPAASNSSTAPFIGNPKRIHEESAQWPVAAIDAGLTKGTVIFALWIGKDGKVTKADLKDASHPVFVNAAREAVMKWLFEPTNVDVLVPYYPAIINFYH